MDKYTGCNKVESAVTTAQKPKKKSTRWRGFLIRLAVSAVIIAFFLCVAYLPFDALEPVRQFLHKVFCFDFFGRTSFGTSIFFA